MNQQSQHLDTHCRTSGTLVQINSRHNLILKVNVITLVKERVVCYSRWDKVQRLFSSACLELHLQVIIIFRIVVWIVHTDVSTTTHIFLHHRSRRSLEKIIRFRMKRRYRLQWFMKKNEKKNKHKHTKEKIK